MATDSFLVTCEHGGNRIPAPYRRLFHRLRPLLDSHRGYDPGALLMAKVLARAFTAPLVTSTVSRLVIDLNRSIGHPKLFSAATRDTPVTVRENIIALYYRPYRAEVERQVKRSVARGQRAIHISSHSFTPALDGKVRNAGRPRCVLAGRRGSRQSHRSFGYAATILMPEKATG
jgi:predicted N-formylglutamate amidohydrolase